MTTPGNSQRGRDKARKGGDHLSAASAGRNSRKSISPRAPSPAPPTRLPPKLPTRPTPSPSPPVTPTDEDEEFSIHTSAKEANAKRNDTQMTSNTTKTYQLYQKNPILAIGAAMTIQLVEIYASNDHQLRQTRDTSLIRVRGVGQVQLDDVIVGMKWLNEQVCQL